MKMQPWCKIADMPMPFTALAIHGKEAMLKQLDSAKKKPSEQDAAFIKTVREEVTALQNFAKDLNMKGSVDFRVFVDLGKSDGGSHDVTLFKSDKGAAGGDNKNKKRQHGA